MSCIWEISGIRHSDAVMEKKQRLSCDGASLLCELSQMKKKATWEIFSGPRRTVCSEGLVRMDYTDIDLTWFLHHR